MDASNFEHILRKVIIVPILALVAGAAVLGWQIDRANETFKLIQLQDERITQTLTIEKFIIDEETGLRGFETTHDPRLLQPYLDASAQLPAAFDRRRSLAVTSPARQAALDALRAAHDTWQQGFASPVISTIRAGGETNDVALNYQGKLLMDDIRSRIAALNSVTMRSRDVAVQKWHYQVQTMIAVLLVSSIVVGLIIGLYIRRLIQQISGAFRQSHDSLRIRAEQTFRSEEKLQTTLRSISDGVITCDAGGYVQTLNDTAQELTGWSDVEARSQTIAHIFPTFDETTREPLQDPVSRVTRSNQSVRLQNHTILRRKDGSEIFIEDSGAPIRDKHGNLIGVVLVFRDVTIAKKSQEALLANEKLAIAGRLAASIAHEIHNPLDSVSNLLFLMDGVATDEERTHFLSLAKQEIARVTQISRAMLSLYRESKTPVLIDLREMLDSILLLMANRFQTLRVEVTHDVPDALCIHGFPAELRQVFTNLLTNAAEATGAGGHIHLSAQLEPAGIDPTGMRRGEGVIVTVHDNGPGIPADIISSLFQPFFTTKGERGTGLGLWISRGIITKHGGAIDLSSSTSAEDHGTTINVYLAANPTISLPAS